MEWTVITVLVVVVGLISSIIKPLLTLNKTLVVLNITTTDLGTKVSSLDNQIKELTDNNSKGHARLWDQEAEQDKTINEHELRITELEKK